MNRRPTAVLVVRVWMDGDRPASLRARITSTADVSQRSEVNSVASSPDQIRAAMSQWLGAFLAGEGVARGSRASFTQR
ncbi:MAG: hypothetical protein QOJ13_3245 [Gaiellales bacterium]|jgi:hypothetical protein|nr:hypothetical protein [Gaiellales bacterium]MDX6594049.1 hypothetical protein [Gaiellales bacterium]